MPAWPDYRAVWRWHFYAGLFCIPLVCWLACSGAAYLFRPQIEHWLDEPYAHLVGSAEVTAQPSSVVRAALAAFPGARLHAYQLPATADAAPQLLIGRGDDEWRVWVHPVTLSILKAVPEDDRLMNLVFHLHGELLLGDRGSMLVELAASWAIIMVLTGIYLWWPRRTGGLAGVLYPRLWTGRRIFWRDLHAVSGLWMTLPVLFLLVSGLPWAANWGAYLDAARQLAGQVSNERDWAAGSSAPPAMPMVTNRKLTDRDYLAVDRVVPGALALRFDWPVIVSPQADPIDAWTVRSNTQNRPRRETATIDGETGALLSRQGFSSRDTLDRIVDVGVAAHEGQLFGWPNQLLGLLTAALLLLASVSAAIHWWQRRPSGVLGAPVPNARPRFAPLLVLTAVVLGMLLPLFGTSLLIVVAVERLVLIRLPRLSRWLGLRAAGHSG